MLVKCEEKTLLAHFGPEPPLAVVCMGGKDADCINVKLDKVRTL